MSSRLDVTKHPSQCMARTPEGGECALGGDEFCQPGLECRLDGAVFVCRAPTGRGAGGSRVRSRAPDAATYLRQKQFHYPATRTASTLCTTNSCAARASNDPIAYVSTLTASIPEQQCRALSEREHDPAAVAPEPHAGREAVLVHEGEEGQRVRGRMRRRRTRRRPEAEARDRRRTRRRSRRGWRSAGPAVQQAGAASAALASGSAQSGHPSASCNEREGNT